MNSTTLMLVMIAGYIVIAVYSAYERNWPRVLYCLAVAVLSVSIIWMQVRD